MSEYVGAKPFARSSERSQNPRDVRTQAIVLRRTDYGEADRILQLLTPLGKQSVIAKGVRREKSRLAGGIELFCVSDVMIHKNKTRAEMGILTGARLREYFDAFVQDIDLIEMGGGMMREVNAAAEMVESPEFFEILVQVFREMQKCVKRTANGDVQAGKASEGDLVLPKAWKEILSAWWAINLARVLGEEVNLRFDTDGEKLQPEMRYYWSEEDVALAKAPQAGRIRAEHIKLMRVMAAAPAAAALRVRGVDDLIGEVSYIAKCLRQAR